ncbi:MAG: T9SS type A sorting domain-containing protein [Saprospiraceae bacterium]|nr:T9SS type A sorting domain-containing protein [Saprospiraceae bacterium]
MGVSVFGGSLTTDQFRGTAFGAHASSLYLPNANAVLGSQTHTENCWQENSGAAVYGVTPEYAQNYRFLVDEMTNSCFRPVSYSPDGWFQNLPNANPEVVCSSEICKTTNFKPDSDDVKRLTDGDTTLLPAVRWELQRYIYEKLLTEAPEDTTNEKFRDNVENTTIGFFQAINENIAAMFAADSVSRAALNANLIVASGKLDSLILIDSLVTIEDDSSEIAGLMQIRGGLTEVLFDLASDSESLTEEISDNFSDAADDIRALNDTITVIEDFEINEKVFNDLYLAYLAEADTSEMDTLEAIAAQCPLLGGNAVYRSRALLAMMTGELASYNDSLNCASVQALSLPHGHNTSFLVATDLTIFPNPANGEVNIRWKRAPEKQGQIQVTDLYGRQVRQMVIAPGATEIKIPADHLPDGMYFFSIRLDDLETTRKIIIQH